VEYIGEERRVYKVLVGKLEGKRPLRRPRHRWEDGIGMYLGEICCGQGGVGSVGSGYGLVAGSFECGCKPSSSDATDLIS
jgi:hypothetical protein